MMKKYVVELSVGLLMCMAVVALVFLAFRVGHFSEQSSADSYTVSAQFDQIGGLKVRAPVRISGVRVGEVQQIILDPQRYQAVTQLRIDNKVQIPVDSSAAIVTEGLLGTNYIQVTPGFEKAHLRGGGRIQETHSALILEQMIGHLLYSFGGNSTKASLEKHS